MKRVLKRQLACLIALAFALGCDGSLRGRLLLVDGDGDPVDGAIACLVLWDERRLVAAEFSDAQGCVSVGAVVSPFLDEGHIVVWKPGLEPTEVDIEPGFEKANEFRVVLSVAGEANSQLPEPVSVECSRPREGPRLPSWIEEGRPIPPSIPVFRRLERKCLEVPGFEFTRR